MMQPLAELEQQWVQLHAQLAEVGDSRLGHINATYRRCGMSICGELAAHRKFEALADQITVIRRAKSVTFLSGATA
jgi:hypothetical protein